LPRPKPGHHATNSESGTITSPPRPTVSRTTPVPSPRSSPAKSKTAPIGQVFSSPSRDNEEFSLVVPSIGSLRSPLSKASPTPTRQSTVEPEANGSSEPVDLNEAAGTPSKSLQVYEDPFTEDQLTPRPPTNGGPERPVLEDRPINEDAANLSLAQAEAPAEPGPLSPDKMDQNARLLDSGIKRVKAQSLDVHGFRRLQSLLRDTKTPTSDEKFDALLIGLFDFLESPLEGIPAEKVQDVKTQVLATIKLLLKKTRENFQPHVSRGLEALLAARSLYDARTHIVSGLELLAEELVKIGDPATIAVSMNRRLEPLLESTEPRSHRSLSMGLHILTRLMENHATFMPTDSELAGLLGLTSRCLESKESTVRMDAVHLCVELHARVGEATFWDNMRTIKDDPKSLITYYVVKRQRETGVGA
jgi:CLIP-associating protein 1/2